MPLCLYQNARSDHLDPFFPNNAHTNLEGRDQSFEARGEGRRASQSAGVEGRAGRLDQVEAGTEGVLEKRLPWESNREQDTARRQSGGWGWTRGVSEGMMRWHEHTRAHDTLLGPGLGTRLCARRTTTPTDAAIELKTSTTSLSY
jgi:hypothetical protein